MIQPLCDLQASASACQCLIPVPKIEKLKGGIGKKDIGDWQCPVRDACCLEPSTRPILETMSARAAPGSASTKK